MDNGDFVADHKSATAEKRRLNGIYYCVLLNNEEKDGGQTEGDLVIMTHGARVYDDRPLPPF